ncbi:MAG TPA: glycosyl hydrolase [Solirubrobacterales bacterium]|nr:glycosyl hydrolase [Solirubrobacterales bacterium]
MRRLQAAPLLLAALALLPPSVAAAAQRPPIAFGVYLEKQWKDPRLIDSFSREVGRKPAIILSYKRWDVKPFYPPELKQISRRGAMPMVSWEPWSSSGKPAKLWAIGRGRYDGYVRRSARQAREWGKPIMLRFGQEMNGEWAPWERGHVGSTPRSFILAWRHLVRVFREVGADNVIWVWCPNVNTGHLPFMQYYPGDAWVDWVGLDGFNWGGSIGWRSISEVFVGSYEQLARETSKPIVIAETGSGQTGGDKAAWVTSALEDELANFSRVRAVVWYNAFDRADFRIDSSPSALQAFRRGIARPLYAADRRDLIETPPRLTEAVSPIPIPDAGYGQPPLPERLWRKLHDRLGDAVWVLIGGAALILVGGVALLVRRRRRPRPRAAFR